MFAGIVENAGRVLSLQERTEAWLLELALPFADGEGLEAGSSLSVNGCCLTLREDSDGKEASFDLLEETMERTNLSGRVGRQFGQPGKIVARERARAVDIL